MANKYIYRFDEGNGSMREILGGKGANLAEMTNLGMPVPQGFTISAEVCSKYYEDGETLSDDLLKDISAHVAWLEKDTGKQFGNAANPLLVSVRSGARASMPGMMDTILNLGLNEKVVDGLAKLTGNPRFAYDSYRRFIQMFSDVVMGIDKSDFEIIIDAMKKRKGIKYDTDLDADDMRRLVAEFKELYYSKKKEDFPSDPHVQLIEAVKAVFRSWNNDRAIVYRRLNDIPSSWGTAVNIQSMVYGNMGPTSGTGVAFTRNPATGEKKLYGEFLMNAQGEDVVAGIRTPEPISALRKILPETFDKFSKIAQTLEEHYRDMQDMEFTIENGKLYMLQTRNGKRTAEAAIKIAVDLVDEGMLSIDEALLKVEPKQLDSLLHPRFEKAALDAAAAAAIGIPASPGAAYGKVYFTAEDATRAHEERGEKVILVRLETSPEDIEGMISAEGILTVRGGATSHAAVVARGMGKCCIAGCGAVTMHEGEKSFEIDGKFIYEGDTISLDGSTGKVYLGEIKTIDATISGQFERFMKWADDRRALRVHTNADTPKDAAQALAFGAEGIGLCRTEHMFFNPDRIMAMREMIVSDDSAQRREALLRLLPMQRGDFKGIFRVMHDKPVTIRLLDPPLHEFLPKTASEIEALAKEMGMTVNLLKSKIDSLHELNPMLGHRGCRLAISYPEIAEMQTRAVIEAAIDVTKEGINVRPEIMIPLVGEINELKFVKKVITTTAEKIMKEAGVEIQYKVGTMIELPRAALTADKIATEAEFFSFGTNDLTQMTYGFSRDDAGKFLEYYYKQKVFESDPFAKLDREGVGRLIRMASDLGRAMRPDIMLGICGEHGGDPSSIEFCHIVGLDYVSCSPFRVPIARLAAAQAAINFPNKD